MNERDRCETIKMQLKGLQKLQNQMNEINQFILNVDINKKGRFINPFNRLNRRSYYLGDLESLTKNISEFVKFAHAGAIIHQRGTIGAELVSNQGFHYFEKQTEARSRKKGFLCRHCNELFSKETEKDLRNKRYSFLVDALSGGVGGEDEMAVEI